MKTKLPATILPSILILFLLLIIAYQSPQKALSAIAGHVVISEVQIAGDSANDEFVELYNPTDTAVDLTDWRLTRKTASGSQSTLVNSLSGSIAPHGFLLLAHPDYNDSVTADIIYSATSSGIANNNTVVLYSDAGVTVVDKVGMGTATDVETAATSVPTEGGSIERKATSNATNTSMQAGGSDETHGNSEDTDNNANDFVIQEVAHPQNSTSPTEILSGPSPDITPAPSITPTPEASATPTPSASANPTPTPSATPNASPLPTPTSLPSAQPSPTATPLPSPITKTIFKGMYFTCSITYYPISSGWFTFKLPIFRCVRG